MSISVSVRMNVENNFGQVRQLFAVPSQQSEQSVQRIDSAIVNVSTNVQTVTLDNVGGTAGYAYFRNVALATADINGTVQTNSSAIALGAWDGTNLNAFAALLPGEPALVPLARTVQLAVQLQTAAAIETNAGIWNTRLHYAVNGR